MTAAVPANTAGATTRFGMAFNTFICAVVGGVLLTGGFGTMTGTKFAVVFRGIDFATFDKNLDHLLMGALPLISVLMNDTFRNLAASATAT